MIYPVSIASAEAFGAAELELQTVRPPSIYVPEPLTLAPAGVAPGGFDAPMISAGLLLAGFGGEAFGMTLLKIHLLAAAAASGEAFGTAQVAAADWNIAVLPLQ